MNRRQMMKGLGAVGVAAALPSVIVSCAPPDDTPTAIFNWKTLSGEKKSLVVKGRGPKLVRTEGWSCFVDPETKTLWNLSIYRKSSPETCILFDFKFV